MQADINQKAIAACLNSSVTLFSIIWFGLQINVHFGFITHKDQSMHYIPLKRSAGVVIFYGLPSSNAGIIVRKSIKLML